MESWFGFVATIMSVSRGMVALSSESLTDPPETGNIYVQKLIFLLQHYLHVRLGVTCKDGCCQLAL